jgi:hypothetical protein
MLFAVNALVYSIESSTPLRVRKEAQARERISILYARANSAASRRDVEGLFRDFDPGARIVTAAGKTTSLAEIKLHTRALFATARHISASSTITGFSLTGNVARVVVLERATIILEARGGSGTSARLENREIDFDTWVKGRRGWKETQAVVRTIHQTLDGKPIPVDG